MALSISYTPKKNTNEAWFCSAKPGASPFHDWNRLKRPSKTVFKHTSRCMCDTCIIMYDPDRRLLYIDVTREYWSMTAVAIIDIDHHEKKLAVRGAYCKAVDHWPWLNGEDCPKGEGGARFLRRALQHIHGFNVLRIVARDFFGSDWRFLPVRRGTIDPCLLNVMYELDTYMRYPSGPWGKTTALFDLSLMEERAATKIQSVFRGWKARMKYRYSPYTALGKHIILRDAGFTKNVYA